METTTATKFKVGDLVRDRNSGAASQWVTIKSFDADGETVWVESKEIGTYGVWVECLTKNVYR